MQYSTFPSPPAASPCTHVYACTCTCVHVCVCVGMHPIAIVIIHLENICKDQ